MNPGGPPRLVATGLAKRLAGRPVLQGIDLELRPGEAVVVAGANGAGKSTLLKCLAGIWRPSAGRVTVDGAPWNPGAEPPARRRAGILAHEGWLHPDLDARENLGFFARLYGVPQPDAAADAWIARAGLAAAAGRPVRSYSRGMVQRLALARTFLHDPDLLFLDEPAAGLDARAEAWAVDLVRGRLEAGAAAVVVAHDLAAVWPVASGVMALDGGRVAFDARPAETSLDDVRERLFRLLEGSDRRPATAGYPAKPGGAAGGRR